MENDQLFALTAEDAQIYNKLSNTQQSKRIAKNALPSLTTPPNRRASRLNNDVAHH